jgi:hypothetical protein
MLILEFSLCHYLKFIYILVHLFIFHTVSLDFILVLYIFFAMLTHHQQLNQIRMCCFHIESVVFSKIPIFLPLINQ